MLTIPVVQAMLPYGIRDSVSQDFVDRVMAASQDPDEAESIKELFISYTHVLKEGKFKLEDYLNAIKYVSYKQMGLNNGKAYEKTFPQKVVNLRARGATDKEISAFVSQYHKGKLVNLIMEQSLIPMWLLNQDAYQKAINTQVQIMKSSTNDMARTQAANSLLTHLKKPEAAKIELDITTRNDGLEELRSTLLQMAEQQQQLIANGATVKDVVQQPLRVIEGEVIK